MMVLETFLITILACLKRWWDVIFEKLAFLVWGTDVDQEHFVPPALQDRLQEFESENDDDEEYDDGHSQTTSELLGGHEKRRCDRESKEISPKCSDAWVSLEAGFVRKRILKEGDDSRPSGTATVKFQYMVANNPTFSLPVINKFGEGNAETTKLNETTFPSGIILCLSTMGIGEEADLRIDSSAYGYGDRECRKLGIAASQPLFVRLRLIDIVESERVERFLELDEMERLRVSTVELRAVAENLVKMGHISMHAEKFKDAVTQFEEVVQETAKQTIEKEDPVLRADQVGKAKAFLGLAQAHASLNNWKEVIPVANTVVALNIAPEMAICLLAKAHLDKPDLPRANCSLALGFKLAPASATLLEIQGLYQKTLAEERALCQKMFAPAVKRKVAPVDIFPRMDLESPPKPSEPACDLSIPVMHTFPEKKTYFQRHAEMLEIKGGKTENGVSETAAVVEPAKQAYTLRVPPSSGLVRRPGLQRSAILRQTVGAS